MVQAFSETVGYRKSFPDRKSELFLVAEVCLCL